MRKHYAQMSDDEYKLLLLKIRERSYSFSPHAFERMCQKKVAESQVLAMLTYCSVIELHNDATADLRVLVRGKVSGNYVCAVLSLTRNEVITVYWNSANDFHCTLDASLYQWEISVAEALKLFSLV